MAVEIPARVRRRKMMMKRVLEADLGGEAGLSSGFTSISGFTFIGSVLGFWGGMSILVSGGSSDFGVVSISVSGLFRSGVGVDSDLGEAEMSGATGSVRGEGEDDESSDLGGKGK